MRKVHPFRLKRFSITEADEQASVVAWARMYEHRLPALRLLYAVPNGAIAGPGRFPIVAMMKKMGMKNGVPDLVLPVARQGHHALYIEMKRGGGVPSDVEDDQEQWHAMLRDAGNKVEVCFGATRAIEALENYCRAT